MAFRFKLVRADGSPADPESFATAVPSWKPGDTFLARPGHVLRVIEVREGDVSCQGVLVVEDAY